MYYKYLFEKIRFTSVMFILKMDYIILKKKIYLHFKPIVKQKCAHLHTFC